MRKIAFCLLLQLFIVCVQAAEVTIKKISVAGKPAYFVRVSAFPHENNALQLKFKLSSSISHSITIEQEPNQKFAVKIGPINDLIAARALKIKLLEETKAYESSKWEPNRKPESIYKQLLLPSKPIPAMVLESTQEQSLNKSNTNKKLWILRNADIRAVIAEVSRVTAKNFLVDPRVQGKISITSSKPMSNEELYHVFLSMLQISGYAAIPSGEVIKIVPNMEAKTISPFGFNLTKHPRGDEMMVSVIPVHYVPAEQLVPVLRPLMPQWSSVSAYSPSNMLILSGRASNIRQLARIIKQVDSSTVNGIDVVRLKHALAMDVAGTLKDLLKSQAGGGMGHSQTMLAVDDRSNALLLSGTKTERIRMRLLIHQLDNRNYTGFESNTKVIYLHYLRAEDLAPILAGVAQANFSGNVGITIGTITRPELDSTNPASNMVGGFGSTATPNSALTNNPPPAPALLNKVTAIANTTGAPTQNEGSTKPTVQIIAEPNTNSVIINAPISIIHILQSVVRQLDIRPAQILIEAIVAEINENDIKELGIEWGSITERGRPVTSFRPGFAIINSTTAIDQFQAEIFALARQQKANILSTPSVVVLDNRQAKILVGKQVSVTSTTYPNNAGGTTIGSPYETFNRVNVALHLYVRPQITQGEGIQLQIDQGNDTIDPGSANNTTNPIFDISSIVTSVHIESGDIVVLGGLIQNSVGDTNNKIPIIGDIPGFGRLFQHNLSAHEKRILMVFLRPVIIHNEREAVEISGSKYQDIRQYELNMLRQEVYNKENEAMILPPLSQAMLPLPFQRPAKPPLVTMTK